MQRFLCIHGHFYQPPRENAWLERIDRQESAHPFHDWNERIESECYGANARARILDAHDRVIAVVNNFAKMSFNIGPTLLSWMEMHAPRTYAGILEADRESAASFGRGSAMAQVYNHVIMPLANERDKVTQVRWGVRDFESRFGRKPEGMWLAEAAVDTASLRALVDEGITFTVLSPRQVRTVKLAGSSAHLPVTEATLDTRRPYRVDVGGGRSITVFFYDGSTSQAVAFERLLASGDTFAGRLTAAFSSQPKENELVHIATDGETYGHHHRFGEMALAYALRRIETSANVKLTNYASYLALNPARDEATIVEASSWSCAHGVGRWSADCGCRMRGDSNQAWRRPLREALDFVAARADEVFERDAAALVRDPWDARDRFVDVVLDRSPGSVDRFFADACARDLSAAERGRALSLFEMQRHRLLMYTSCGWFFDDVSGLETAQILQYGCRAIELMRELGHDDLQPEFLERLESAKATTPKTPNAREVVEKTVLPARADAAKVAATVAVASLFGLNLVEAPAFTVEEREIRTTKREGVRLATGNLNVTSNLTGGTSTYAFSVLHEGGPTVKGGLRLERAGGERNEPERWAGAFEEESPDSLKQRIEEHFPIAIGPLRQLLLDERVMVVERILAEAVRNAEHAYRQVMSESASLLTELAATGVRAPRALTAATRVVIESDLLRAARKAPPDTRALKNLLAEARAENVAFDEPALAFEITEAIDRTCLELELDPALDRALGRLGDLVAVGRRLNSPVDLSRAQDIAWAVVMEPKSELGRIAREHGRVGAWRELAHALRLGPEPAV